MGRTHALSGAVLALATIPVVNELAERFHYAPVEGAAAIAAMAVGAAGGAMLPDLDHPQGTAARTLGPVSQALASVIASLTGGHRHGTHSLVGVLAFTALSWWIGTLGGWPLGMWLAFLFAVAAAALRVRLAGAATWWSHALLCAAGGAALVWTANLHVIPVAAVTVGVAVGCVAHLLGDALTKEGVPLAWPVAKVRLRLANVTTGSFFESIILANALVLILAWQIVALTGVLHWSGLQALVP